MSCRCFAHSAGALPDSRTSETSHVLRNSADAGPIPEEIQRLFEYGDNQCSWYKKILKSVKIIKSIMIIGNIPGDAPLTDIQMDMYIKMAEIGMEMNTLYKQTTRFLNDIGEHKAKPRKRKAGFVCHPDSDRLYKALFKMEYNNCCARRSAGDDLRGDLMDVLETLDLKTFGKFKRLMIDGVERFSDALVAPWVWKKEQNCGQIVGLSNESEMIEGDLALLVAFARRYKDWVVGIRPHVKKTSADRFLKDIDRLEQQAMTQLTEKFTKEDFVV